MERYDFIKTYIEAVANDTALDTWSKSNFGRSMKVYTGLDNEDLPEAEQQTPLVLIGQPAKTASTESVIVIWRFMIWLIIDSESIKVTAQPHLHEPKGLELMLNFIELIQDAVVNAMPVDWDLAIDDEVDTVGMLPEIHGFLDITLNQKIPMGYGIQLL